MSLTNAELGLRVPRFSMSQLSISQLTLANFRNFSSKKIEFGEGINFLVGNNGVGKTNILEGLTVLGKNQSLCGSSLDEMILFEQDSQQKKLQFVIHAKISSHDFIEQIAVSFEATEKKKSFYINGEALSGKRQGEVQNHLINFVFITPQLEQLFILGKSARRDYLDRIVCDLDFAHSTRLNKYQKLLRERLAILQKYGTAGNNVGKKWLEIVEQNIAETGVIIASARIEAINFFNKAITSFASEFPQPQLRLIGDAEESFGKQSAMQFEENYRKKLEENRAQDLASGRTDYGVHRSDFDAIFSLKNVSALHSSTGEQKAIMLGITLARAKISANYKSQPTILIFDEIMSHLDERRKMTLLDEIKTTALQSFCSATSFDLVPENYAKRGEIKVEVVA